MILLLLNNNCKATRHPDSYRGRAAAGVKPHERFVRQRRVTLTKQQVIDSWKNGVTSNQKVKELFTDYYNRINNADVDVTFTQSQLENFLSTNDDWFELIFNSSF